MLSKDRLFDAVYKNNLERVEELIKAKADLNGQNDLDNTVLILAIYYRNASIIKALIEAGADLNIQNRFSQTVLILALLVLDRI